MNTKEFKIDTLGAAINRIRRHLHFSYSTVLHTEKGSCCLELKFCGKTVWTKEVKEEKDLILAYSELMDFVEKEMRFAK